MAVFTVGAGVLLFTTPTDADAQDSPNGDSSISSPEDEIDTVLGVHPEPSPTPTPTPEPEEPVAPLVEQNIHITYGGMPIANNDFSQPRGVPIELGASWNPPLPIDEITIEWENEDPEIFDIEPRDVGDRAVRVMGIMPGTSRLYLRIGDLETSVIVRIT